MSDRIPRAHPGNVFDISAPRGQAKWQNHICLRASQALVSARRSAFGVRRSQRNEAGCCPATLTPALSRKREREQFLAPSPASGRASQAPVGVRRPAFAEQRGSLLSGDPHLQCAHRLASRCRSVGSARAPRKPHLTPRPLRKREREQFLAPSPASGRGLG